MVSEEVWLGREELKTVVLRHSLPDGTFHYDWMFEKRRGGSLVTFRTGVRVDQAGAEGFHGERIKDHRSAYLEYEGDVGGGRGRVARVAEGTVIILHEGAGQMVVLARFGDRAMEWRGTLVGGVLWRFLPVAPDEIR